MSKASAGHILLSLVGEVLVVGLIYGAGLFFEHKLEFLALPPPPLPGLAGNADQPAETDEVAWTQIAVVTIAVVAVLLLLIKQGHPWGPRAYFWGILGVVALAAMATGLYFNLRADWSVSYLGQRYTVGYKLTDHGREYFSPENGSPSKEQAVAEHPGTVEDVWPRDGIDHANLLLGGLFLVCVLLWTVVLLLIGEALVDLIWS